MTFLNSLLLGIEAGPCGTHPYIAQLVLAFQF